MPIPSITMVFSSKTEATGAVQGANVSPGPAVVMLAPRSDRSQTVNMFALVQPTKGCASCKKAY